MSITRILLAHSILLSGISFAPNSLAAPPPAKVRVLVLSGMNNHDWRTTTPSIKRALEGAGRFEVVVHDTPTALAPGAFSGFDVVLSNFNTFTTRQTPPNHPAWSEAARAAYVDFVKGGKGHVSVHAGSASFYDWADYQRLVLGTFKVGQTGHGKYHRFDVTFTRADHPVTRGLGGFTTTDELWHAAALQPGVTVLATAFSSKESGGSGRHEPVLVAGEFGRGRSLLLLLGHDARAMANAGFQALLVRGTEWAATGRVSGNVSPAAGQWPTLPEAIDGVLGYKLGDERDGVTALERAVAAAAVTGEGRESATAALIVALDREGATIDARRVLLSQLKLTASPHDAPAVAKLVADPALSFDARGVLEAVAGNRAADVLRGALAGADAPQAAGLITSLGVLRDDQAVSLIGAYLSRGGPVTSEAAARALGQIGTPAAAHELLRHMERASGGWNRVTTEAVLACADRLRERDAPAARRLYERVAAAAPVPDDLRIGARARTLDTPQAIAAAAQNGDVLWQAAAVESLRRANRPDWTHTVAAGELAKLNPSARWKLLALLADQPPPGACGLLARFVSDEDPTARQLAIRGLGLTRDGAALEPLLTATEKSTAQELKSIRHALSQLVAHDVDARLIARLGEENAPQPVRFMIISSLVDRGVVGSVTSLMQLAGDADAKLAGEAVRAAGELGDARIMTDLIRLLANPAKTAIEGDVRAALASICKRGGRDVSQLAKAYEDADAPTRRRLLAVLPAVGGPGALALVRRARAAADPDTRTDALRALSAWPTPDAVEDLEAIARTTTSATERTLALRGLARLRPATKDPAAAPGASLRWDEQSASAALARGGQILWRFNYDPKLGKPFFDPLAVADHPSLTQARPADHVWHYGLWFSWKYLNGANYWEEDKRTGRAQGLTTWKDVRRQLRPDFSATIRMELDYAPPDQKPVLTEKRAIEVSPPAADGSYFLDWTMTFTARERDVLIDRTPLPGEPDGQVFGGYAGLSLRMKQLSAHRIKDSRGDVAFNDKGRSRQKASYVDYGGELDGKSIGVALFDHPDNPGSPVPWYVIRDGQMNFVNAAVVCYAPMSINAGRSITLRYRVAVHPSLWDAGKLDQTARDFAANK